MNGRCPSTSAPCHCSIQLCRVCSSQSTRCLECAVRFSECSRHAEYSQWSRPRTRSVSAGPSTSRSYQPISPSSARYVTISPGSRVPLLSPAISLPRWNSSKDLWIGEETKRNMPAHVYKYYWNHTMCYRRQSITKVRHGCVHNVCSTKICLNYNRY